MTAQTLTLTDFLLARIAEDEEVARRATGADRTGNWWIDPDEGGVSDISCLDVQGFVTAVDVDATHIARHDPGRVLAECEAKRRIVEALIDMEPVEEERKEQVVTMRWACEMLAHPYADHPDYNPDWRP